MIGVVDYRAGNAPSVMFALARLGLDARLVASADDLDAVDRIILPGVGAARATVDSLAETGMVDALRRRAAKSGVGYTTLIRMIVRAHLNNPLTY
mgnify:CR=1 FL=1